MRRAIPLPLLVLLLLWLPACNGSDPLVVYAGRAEVLVDPVVRAFEHETGTKVRVQYADTSQLAAMLLEEGDRTRADLFWAQDPATLGFLADRGRLGAVPEATLERVDPLFRDPEGAWVGTSGRARVLAVHQDRVPAEERPASLEELTDPRWKGRIGWAPTNASFQAMVAAMIALEGREATEAWLEGVQANAPRVYPSNTPAVLAVAHGEIDVALTNHYYLHRLQAEHGGTLPVDNHYLRDGSAGSLVSVAAIGVLAGTSRTEEAHRFLEWILEEPAQRHFGDVNYELPLTLDVPPHPDLPPVVALDPPALDLADLSRLEETVRLLRDVGAMP